MLTLPEFFTALNTAGLKLVVTDNRLDLAGENVDPSLVLALDHHRQTLQPATTPATPEPEYQPRITPTHSDKCDKKHRHVTDETAYPGWQKVQCDDCGQWSGVRPVPRECTCPADKWHDVGLDSRGWTRIECSQCNAFKGFRPPPQPKKGKTLTVATPKPRQPVAQPAPGLFEADTAQSFALLDHEERLADAMYAERGGMMSVPWPADDDCPF